MLDHHRSISSLRMERNRRHNPASVSPRSISRLQRRNIAKLQSKWSDIIARYSSIDDDTQSDEIDLATGIITVNNGHLTSLSNDSRGIWNLPPESLNPLHNPSHLISTHLDDSTYTHTHHIVPDLGGPISSNSHSFASLRPESSPSKRSDSAFADTHSPTKRRDVAPDNLYESCHSSPIRSSSLSSSPSPSPSSSPSKINSFLDADNDSPTKIPPSPGHDQISPIKHRHSKHIPKLSLARHTPEAFALSKDPPPPFPSLITDKNSFDSKYRLVEDPFGLAGYGSTRIFSCALSGCNYCTGNRQLYMKHLLANHSCEIAALGYPTKLRTGLARTPSSIEATRLREHFPFSVRVPNVSPVVCGMNVGSGETCQHSSLDPLEMLGHREKSPHNCFSGTYVYLCPILGCGFMTEHGFDDWRKHCLEHDKVSLPCTHSPLRDPEYSKSSNDLNTVIRHEHAFADSSQCGREPLQPLRDGQTAFFTERSVARDKEDFMAHTRNNATTVLTDHTHKGFTSQVKENARNASADHVPKDFVDPFKDTTLVNAANTARANSLDCDGQSAVDRVKHYHSGMTDIPGHVKDNVLELDKNGSITSDVPSGVENSAIHLTKNDLNPKNGMGLNKDDHIDLTKDDMSTIGFPKDDANDLANNDLISDGSDSSIDHPKEATITTTIKDKPTPTLRFTASSIDFSAIPVLSPPSNSPMEASFPILSDNVQDLFSDCEWDLPNGCDSDGSFIAR